MTLRKPRFDGLGHAAELLDLLDPLPRPPRQRVGQVFHVVAAGHGIHRLGDPGLLLEDQLGVSRDPGCEGAGQRDGFIEAVGVERLGATQHCGHGFHAGPHHVVVWILLGQRGPAGLAVGAQRKALVLLGAKALHDLGPKQPGRPELGDLGEEVHADREEEADPRSDRIDVEAPLHRGAQILQPIRQGVGQLQLRGRAGLVHVVAGDRDAVEPRHLLCAIREDVTHNPHRWARREDVGVADHELFEDVVLDGPSQLLRLDPLLRRRGDVEGQHRNHGTVHGHRDRHLVEGDPIEQDPHVFDGIDGDPGHAHIPGHPGVVAVVAPVGGEVESDR